MAKIANCVADKIRELRRLRKISQAQLAERVGTAKNTVSRWENYLYTPSVAELEKIAEVLEVDVVDFFPERNAAGKSVELLTAARGLDDGDLADVIKYVHFRRVTAVSR